MRCTSSSCASVEANKKNLLKLTAVSSHIYANYTLRRQSISFHRMQRQLIKHHNTAISLSFCNKRWMQERRIADRFAISAITREERRMATEQSSTAKNCPLKLKMPKPNTRPIILFIISSVYFIMHSMQFVGLLLLSVAFFSFSAKAVFLPIDRSPFNFALHSVMQFSSANDHEKLTAFVIACAFRRWMI